MVFLMTCVACAADTDAPNVIETPPWPESPPENWLAYALDDTMDKWSNPEAVIPKTKDGQGPVEPQGWKLQ